MGGGGVVGGGEGKDERQEIPRLLNMGSASEPQSRAVVFQNNHSFVRPLKRYTSGQRRSIYPVTMDKQIRSPVVL